MVGIDGNGAVDWLNASADTADRDSILSGSRGRHANSGHCCGRHGRVDALQNYAAAVVHDKYASNRVGTIVEGRSEGSSNWGHMLGRQGSIVWTKGFKVGVEGMGYGRPFRFRFASSSFKGFVCAKDWSGIEAVMLGLVEAARNADLAWIGHVSIHWRRLLGAWRLWWSLLRWVARSFRSGSTSLLLRGPLSFSMHSHLPGSVVARKVGHSTH